jgi:hypothetical protein
MFSIRTISRSKPSLRAAAYIRTRSFHSPFHLLGAVSPLTTPQSLYEKQSEESPQPTTTHSGTQAYVVSEPDPLDKHYNVPTGAYPTTAPYQNFDATSSDASPESANKSSTSPKVGDGGLGLMNKEATRARNGGES